MAQSCLPLDGSIPGFAVPHHLPEGAQIHIHHVGDAIQPSHHPLISVVPSLPALNPSQHQVFSNESPLHIRWSKDWNFSFSTSLSSKHSGLISFRMDWLDLLAVRGTLKSLLQPHKRLSLQSLAEQREAAGPTLGLRAGFHSQQANSQPQADEYLSIRALWGNGRLGSSLCMSVT